jgi:polar amino acid transport system substrate-binding protein
MKKLFTLASLLVLASLVLAACGGGGAKEAASDNLLDNIKERGYILVSTDPNYEPQSFLNTNGKRPSDTKCPADALTTAEMQGFDVDVAHKIGDAIGVETCFATPAWDAITAGNWADKWDLSVGSMTITVDRQKILNFSVPYYYTPAVVAVGKDSGFKSLDELAGKNLCAGTSTTYESWINNDMTALGLPATSIYAKAPAGVKAVTLETDQECAQSIAAGRTDFVGYVTSQTVVDANIAAGMPVVQLGSPVYSEDLAAAIDKAATRDTATLLKVVDNAITTMHTDGTLTAISNQWFKSDLTKAPK